MLSTQLPPWEPQLRVFGKETIRSEKIQGFVLWEVKYKQQELQRPQREEFIRGWRATAWVGAGLAPGINFNTHTAARRAWVTQGKPSGSRLILGRCCKDQPPHCLEWGSVCWLFLTNWEGQMLPGRRRFHGEVVTAPYYTWDFTIAFTLMGCWEIFFLFFFLFLFLPSFLSFSFCTI